MNNLFFSIPLSIIIVSSILLLNNMIIKKITLDRCDNNIKHCIKNKINIATELHERQFFIMNSVCLGILILLPFIKNKTYNISLFISFIILMLINFYKEWSNVDEIKLLSVLFFYLVIFLLLIGLNDYGIKKLNDIKLFNF
jgi:hypothetical protein